MHALAARRRGCLTAYDGGENVVSSPSRRKRRLLLCVNLLGVYVTLTIYSAHYTQHSLVVEAERTFTHGRESCCKE